MFFGCGMARAIFPHELSDPDFSWLINSFRESNPGYVLFESSNLPLILLPECGIFADRAHILPAELVPGDPADFADDQELK